VVALELEEDGDDWGDLLFKYVSFGTKQAVKIPSFDEMMYLCDPAKTINRENKNEKLDSAEKLDVTGMIKNGKYKDLIRLLLIDEEAEKDFDKYLEEEGIKIKKYPSFKSKEEKLTEIKTIITEAKTLRQLQTPSLTPSKTKEVKRELDENDIEYE